jgi:hypothetical protein
MRTGTVLALLAVLCLALGPPTVVGAKPAGQGAFLVEYADGVSQVTDQVEGNRLVALRYAKHFRTEPSTVLTYFRNELELTTLKVTSTLTVYFLDESRNIVSETREFKSGTKLFANRGGIPVLQYGTGNPLAATLPLANGIKRLAEELNSQPEKSEDVVVQVLEQPPTELTPAEAAKAAAQDTVTMTEAVTVASSPTLPPGTPTVGTSDSSARKWLLPVGLAGAVAIFAGGGGGGAPVAPDNNGNPPPVIPEPSGFAILGAGVITLAGSLYRMKRR